MSGRDVITYIQTDNTNKTKGFSSISDRVIITELYRYNREKSIKNEFIRWVNRDKGGKHTNQLSEGTYNAGVQKIKSLTIT